jgi:hypothetical protein
MPVLHPMMTGAVGAHHQIDWLIGDPDAGYVKPAQSLAMMAVELLRDDARQARHVLSQFLPGMSKEDYLEQQRAVFRTEKFDGHTVDEFPPRGVEGDADITWRNEFPRQIGYKL